MAAMLLLVGVGSVRAQGYVGGGSGGAGSGLNGVAGMNGAGALNGGSSAAGQVSEPRHIENVQATNPGEFVPSTFENYSVALSLGKAAGRNRQLTVVEAARLSQQARAAGTARPAIVLEKNAEGKLIIVETKPAQTNP